MDRKPQLLILADIDGIHERFRVPDLTRLRLILWHCSISCRILFHQIPLNCLIETAPQDLMHIPDRARPCKLPILLSRHCIWNRRCLQQPLIVPLQKLDADIFQLRFSDQWIDVIVDQAHIPVIGLQGPLVPPVEGYIFLKQPLQSSAVWNNNFPVERLHIKFQLPPFCLREGIKCFPLLLPVPLFINIIVDYLILPVSRCK